MEDTNYLHKPSLIQSLDVSHIVSKHFGSMFTSDCVDPEIIENLTVSQGSTDEDHHNYVMQLIKVTSEREKLFELSRSLREHIYSARDKALQDDNVLAEENKDFAYLNLPPTDSTFFKYINNDFLRENGLIAPADIILTLNSKSESNSLHSSAGGLLNDDGVLQRSNTKEFKKQNSNKTAEFRLPPIERAISAEKGKKTKENKKYKAPDMILAVDRDEDKYILEKMASKNNYLKNPRHLLPGSKTQSKDWLIKVNCTEESPRMFIAIPEFIEFSDYEIGKVYEKVVNLRNITSVLRNIRVLPPKTRYYSLGLGQFPGEKGLVAAGMSCQYAIRFSPDSLGDFEDEIIVETQGGNTFVVKLKSKRPRPSLSGGKIWDMGYNLVYGLKVVHYTIKNSGGNGRFCLIDSSIWPISNPKSFITNKQIILEPFILRPSYFELRSDETITLELMFCPIKLGAVEREFLVLCDNCHMQTFTIKGHGETASIEMESIEDGVSIPDLGESTDISAQFLVKFGALNPFTYCQKIIVLKNGSHTEVPFSWKIIKPNLKSPSFDDEDSSTNMVQNRMLDFDSAFLIEPPFGVFPPNDSMAFTITFAPLEVKENHSVLHLVLHGIPDIKTEQTSYTELQNEGSLKQKSLTSFSEEAFHNNQTIQQISNPQIKTVCLNDVTSLEIEVKGACIPLEVSLNPPAIVISGDLLINTPVRKQLQISNKSMCPVNVNWKNSDSDSHIFTVEPQLGMIEPGEIGVVDVCVVSSIPGFVRDVLICTVDNMDTPLPLVVEAKFKGPEIEIEQNNLDFGLVKVNEKVSRVLKIINKSSINCNWRARIGGSQDIELFDEIKILPYSGLLAPLQSQNIVVTLSSYTAKNIACGLEIGLEHGTTKYLNVMACVQSPRVVLGCSNLDISGKLFVNVPSTFKVTLSNQSHLTSKFNWLQIIGQNSDFVSIISEPSQGYIEPNCELIIEVTVTCSRQTVITDLILPCEVDDMDEHVLLQITGMVEGPKLICTLMETSSTTNIDNKKPNLKLDFGEEIPLFQDVKKLILIKNATSIVTKYCLSVDCFKTFSNKVEVSKDRTKIRPNLADRQSKPDKLAHYDFCKEMLGLKLGLAVGFNPSTGILQGYEEVVVEVIVYNDMWGSYNDFIRISGNAQSVETEQIIIPVSITVKGIPLEFTMTSGRKEQKPILRLGSRPLGHKSISRKVRLNNKSPCALYINWEMYSQAIESDDKIIDFLLCFGDPFPISKSINDSESIQYLDSTRLTDINESVASNSTRIITDRALNISSEFDYIEKCDIKTDERFISVILRSHEGVLSSSPINFDPPQLMIPSESFGFVTVTFDPQLLDQENDIFWDHNHGISYNNFLLGFVSLQDKDLRKENYMVRQHQYKIEQVKLDITGRILLPSLQIEYPEDEEEVRYKVPFSSLLNIKYPHTLSKTKTFTSCVTLRNLKDTEITFSLKTRFPFDITNQKLCDNAVLGIGEAIKIEVKFTMDKRQLSLLNDITVAGNDESKCLRVLKKSIPESPDRVIKTAIFRDVVSINYASTSIEQMIPLRAVINFPEFVLSKSTIDFKTCFIGETCTEYFRILNKSDSSSVVFLRLDGVSNSVFELKEKECFIPYNESNTNDNQFTVTVNFTPKQAVDYSATIVLCGMMGEEECNFPIYGKGSYDNQHQKKY